MISKWSKKDRYYATNGAFTMSWNDVGKFTLYYGNDFVETGTKEECLEAFKRKIK